MRYIALQKKFIVDKFYVYTHIRTPKMLESIEDEAVMSFKNIGISTVNPPKPILSNISGYIQKGGITAGKKQFYYECLKCFFILFI